MNNFFPEFLIFFWFVIYCSERRYTSFSSISINEIILGIRRDLLNRLFIISLTPVEMHSYSSWLDTSIDGSHRHVAICYRNRPIIFSLSHPEFS